MKKFKFTLEKVLTVKNQLYEVKRGELAELQKMLRDIERLIDENRAIFRKYNDDVNQIMKSGTNSSSIETYKQYFTYLNQAEKDLLAQKAETEELIALKQQEIIEVKSEISGLEKLKEKQLAEYNKALQKEQEREIEEFISEKLTTDKLSNS